MTSPLFITLMLYALSTFTSMALMSIGAALYGLGFLWVRAHKSVLEVWRTPAAKTYLVLTLLFVLACVASLMNQQFLLAEGQRVPVQWGKDLAKLWYLFWPLILAPGIRALTQAQQKKVLKVWWFAAVVISFFGCIQFFTGWPRKQEIPGFEGYFHVTLFFGHHLSTASILIFPFFLGPVLTKLKILSRQTLVLGSLLILLALFGTFARSVWLALPLGVALFVFFELGSFKKARRYQAAWLLFLSMTLMVVYQLPVIQKRLNYSEGVNQRYNVWSQYLEMWKAQPLLGVGFQHTVESHRILVDARDPTNPYRFVGHAHNNALEVLTGTGIFGLMAWLFWWIFVLYFAWRSPFAPALFCALIVYHLNGITQVNFFESKVLHQLTFMLGWILASVRTGLFENQSKEKS